MVDGILSQLLGVAADAIRLVMEARTITIADVAREVARIQQKLALVATEVQRLANVS